MAPVLMISTAVQLGSFVQGRLMASCPKSSQCVTPASQTKCPNPSCRSRKRSEAKYCRPAQRPTAAQPTTVPHTGMRILGRFAAASHTRNAIGTKSATPSRRTSTAHNAGTTESHL